MKLKLLLVSLLFSFAAAVSQNTETPAQDANTIKLADKPSRAFKQFDLKTLNRPKSISSPFESNNGGAASGNTAGRTYNELEPFAQIDIPRWGVISNIETGGDVLFSAQRIGNDFNVKTYDEDIEIAESFSIEVPESANQVEVMNHYSSNFFSNDGYAEFMVYVHYFEGTNPGPDDQVWEVWVVNSNGEILEKLTGFSAEAKIDAAGNHKLFTYFDDDTTVSINSIDVATWETVDTYTFDSELLIFFSGSPINYITVDGEEYIAVARYKHLFMDNMTFEVFPDNNLIIKLLDYNLEEVKTMALDIDTRYPDAGEFVIPMADFGTFYRDQTYDISSNIFNADSKLEVAYGIYYYDMINDTEWSTYMVANEDGEMIHELNEYIIDSFKEMNSIEGQDNQLGFLMGENGEATNLAFFNIESWEFELNLEAMHNGDRLSNDFNRIPTDDSYHFVIGLGAPDEENGNIYGVVNEYERDGSLFNRQRFLLPEDVVLFQPILTRYALIPNLFADDDELYYMYLYKEMEANGSVFNNVVISKDTEDYLVEFRGDTGIGNIIGSTFLTDGNGTFNKMTLQYETGNDGLLTDFYRLPFEDILGVETPTEATQFALYPNPTSDFVNIKASMATKNIQVYNIAGTLLINKILGNVQESIDVSALATGLYIAKVTMENGTSQQVKFIKK
ncbi:T9SS type A sorting domain-containing protein [Aequorivita capsosiphonis]|uniref:T9SS type A sorting domain-containing protein n=1 Tax=Aequorivita capsosiphonis TaxID=487317 RepID=UPI000420DA85|nr:T9SS type A sorting domain-containing protein [Aequorivita capsosiphonis]